MIINIHYILVILFLRSISDVWQDHYDEYKKEYGADIAIGAIIRSSYWLDRELFNESYLYQKQKKNLFELQPIHFELVDIGAFLLSQGFPIRYNPEEYAEKGPDQLAPYAKEFVKQCHKRYKLFYEKTSHKNLHKIR